MTVTGTDEAVAPAFLLAYLREHGVDHEVLAPGVPMPTVPLAAAAIGVEETRILKTLVFGDKDGRHVVAVACGPARLDRRALAEAAGLGKASMADPETVLRLTGFPAGGVCPVGHATPLPVLIDRAVMALDVAYGGGGDERLLLRIAPKDILRLTGGRVVDLTGA